MKIIGHRGAAGLVAENTLESVEKALEYQVDGIEIDVHRCKSGELVVIHDETLQRTTNGYGKVSEYSWNELKSYRTIEGYRIPLLSEIFDCIDVRCTLNIELKGVGTAGAVVTLLEKQIKNTKWQSDNFILSSFDHSQLIQIKSMTSDYKIGVLTEKTIPDVLDMATTLDAYAIHPPIDTLTEEAVSLAIKKGYKVYTWTVNDKTFIANAKRWNVDAIITDFPNFA